MLATIDIVESSCKPVANQLQTSCKPVARIRHVESLQLACKPISSQLHNVRPLATGLQLDSDFKPIII
jgi:hypothetical protein